MQSAGLARLKAAFAGRKTYLAGGVLVAVSIAGAWTGHMGALTAVSIAGYGLSLFGFAAKSNRQHKELLLAIESAGALGLAMRTGGIAAVVTAAEKEAPAFIAACTGEDPQ